MFLQTRVRSMNSSVSLVLDIHETGTEQGAVQGAPGGTISPLRVVAHGAGFSPSILRLAAHNLFTPTCGLSLRLREHLQYFRCSRQEWRENTGGAAT
ncbi:hypothetical protein GDO81_026276 [Engystomops pustulosus]|uniref:Uncharacterized protein n=1 Tax=Engystomops pustulosus TaxID=76066 RepID=A0AAV6YMQ2_ENGPU|nr:hypothetical protein GDO81_026276 [Engystomops pustulosus]